MDLPKGRILMNEFFKSQFNYFPIRKFHRRLLNNEINKLHEKCLRIVYNDKKSNFEELLSLYTTEIFKSLLLRCGNLRMRCHQK